MMSWINNIDDVTMCLQSLSVRNNSGKEIDSNLAFSQWADYTVQIREQKNTVYLVGNGASASMASHMAADLAKNALVRTEVLSDLSLLTAVSNDLGYEQVFSEPLRHRMVEGDMLVTISSSGNSPNVVRAAHEAARRGGRVFTVSAMGQDNTLRSLGMLNFYVPGKTYGIAETCHAAILHYWMDLVAAESMIITA